jgi:putative ABC transport system permease protein
VPELFVLIASCLPLLYMLASPPLGENQRRVLFLVVIASALLAAMLAVLALFPAVALRALGALLAPTRRRFPLENRLAIASLGGAEQRVFASVTGLVLVFAGIFLISIVTDSLKAETERFVDRAVAGSVFVKSRPMAKADVVAAAARAGVPEIVSLAAQVQAPFLIRGVPSEVAARAVPALASPEALRAFDEGRSIVLSQLLARSFGYRSGDEVKLSTFTGPKSARVAAISDRLGFFPDDRAWAVMSSRAVHDFFCVDDTEGTNYVVTGGSSGDDCKTRLAEALGAGSVQWIHTGEEMRELYRDDMRHDFLIFDIILLLTVLLASAGMLNSFTIAILQRRREIGLLRAVGVTLRELRTILIMEALSMAVLGGVLALALGLPLAILSVRSIRILSLLDVPLRVSSSVLLLPIGGAVLVATVGCLLPLLRVARLDIAAATKYE